MSRLRESVTLDRDAVSPDSIQAAESYLVQRLEHEAAKRRIAINWNTFRTYTRRHLRSRDLVLTAWARVM